MSRIENMKSHVCRTRKVPYVTRREAVATMKLSSLISRSGQPYKCKWCGRWHIGHKIPKKSDVGKMVRINNRRRKSFKRLLELIDLLCGI